MPKKPQTKSYSFKEQFDGLPWAQLLIVALMRFAEPISFTSLFPYIYFMVKSFQICPEHQIARYAGYISGAFALCQCATGIFWGRMSDKYGRKPIILVGLTGSAVSMLTFGFSSNFYMAVGARCIAGLLNGNVGVIRTLLGEIAKHRRHQALAFSIMPLLWQIGCVIGPMVGGYLALPVSSHPTWFEPGGLFGDGDAKRLFLTYPFLMPNLVVVSVLVFGITVAFLFLEETHDIKKYEYDVGLALSRRVMGLFRTFTGTSCNASSSSSSAAAAAPPPGKDLGDSHGPPTPVDEENTPLLKNTSSASMATQTTLLNTPPPEHDDVDQTWPAVLRPSVVNCLFSAGFIALHAVVYEELLPVFFSSKVQPSDVLHLRGGLGLGSETVGNYLSINGIVGIAVMLVVFPWIDKTYGSLRTFKFAIKLFPIVYFVVPYFVLLPGLPDAVVTAVITANLFVRTLVNSIAHPALLLVANRSPAHTRHLGVVNGCVQVASSFARAVGPIVWGYLMMFGLQIGHVELPWWGLALLALVGAVQAGWMTDKDDDGDEFY